MCRVIRLGVDPSSRRIVESMQGTGSKQECLLPTNRVMYPSFPGLLDLVGWQS